MRYLAAYMLCQLGGSEKPSDGEIKGVLDSVGVEHESDRLSKLLSILDGKDTSALITEGYTKMASVPMGGGAPAAVSATPAASAPAAGAKPVAKEVAKESEKEESDDDMGFGLFD